MKINSIALWLPILFVLTTSNPSYAIFKPDFSRKIGSSVIENMPILVIMKDQADLTGAEKFTTKLEKGQYVYDKLRKKALTNQTDLVGVLQKKGFKFQRFYIMNMVSVDGATAELIQEIAARPDVAKIIGNPTVHVFLSPPAQLELFRFDDPNAAAGENIMSTGAHKVWSDLKVRGEGIVVAGQDTGVDWNHPALHKQYRGISATGSVDHSYSWHDAIHQAITSTTNPCGYNISAPCDDDRHGTHTMGTMIGNDGATNKIGMAPAAQWIACRNMDAGTGRPTTYIECFEFFLAPYPQGGNALTDGQPAQSPHVINNSWGCPPSEGCEGDEILPVLQNMKKAGILVVASAGNDGPTCSTIQDQPADHSEVTFSVGALNHRNGEIAFFSSRGPSRFDGGIGPDVSAPGVEVRSCVPGGGYEQAQWSGTSMAGPHVVGLIALLWSAKPDLVGQIEKTANIVRLTSDPKKTAESCGGLSGNNIPNNTYGYGSINAFRAVSSVQMPFNF